MKKILKNQISFVEIFSCVSFLKIKMFTKIRNKCLSNLRLRNLASAKFT
jgi:hypothetical protein